MTCTRDSLMTTKSGLKVERRGLVLGRPLLTFRETCCRAFIYGSYMYRNAKMYFYIHFGGHSLGGTCTKSHCPRTLNKRPQTTI